MSSLFSRFSLPDYAILGGCLMLLGVMVLFGPGRIETGDTSTDGVPPSRSGAFWSTWPGALVISFGGGALIYGLLALYAASHH